MILWGRTLWFPPMLLFLCAPGCSTMSGPSAVSGPKGGSLTVHCNYTSEWESYNKWWCRGTHWRSCHTRVKTNGPQREVKKGRVSIKDSRKTHTFTVTMEKLRESDADTYWCGIGRFRIDRGVKAIKVSIDPGRAPATMWTTATTITTTSTTTSTVTVPATPEEYSGSPAMTSQSTDVRPKVTEFQILTPVVIALLLLLLTAVSLLAWRMVMRKKRAAGTASEQKRVLRAGPRDQLALSTASSFLSPGNIEGNETLDGDVCYANLTLHHTDASPDSSRKKASIQLASSAQAHQAKVPFPSKIIYTSLSLDTWNQEPVYSNMSHLKA